MTLVTERRQPGPTIARRGLHAWMGLNALTMGAEAYRLWSGNYTMFGETGFLRRSFGNIGPSEAVTWAVDVGENIMIDRYQVPAIWARTVGFLTVVAANVAVEAPELFYHLLNNGDNTQYFDDMSAGGIGYVLMKIPLQRNDG